MRLNLEELMQEHRINQAQLAEELGVSKQSVSAWLKGRSLPDKETLEDLCAYFSIGIATLLIVERTTTRSGRTVQDFAHRFAA